MKILAAFVLVAISMLLVACAKAPAVEKKAPEASVIKSVAESTADESVKSGIEGVDVLRTDVDTSALDAMDSDFALIDDLE